MLVEARFLVPLREDLSIGNGLHPYTRWETLHRDLFVKFGGWTLCPGVYHGTYQDPDTGKSVNDESRQYILAIERDQIPALREYLEVRVSVDFKQKSIYFNNGSTVELIKNPEIV